MHHKLGKMNIKADILSRRADHNRGEDDNKDITVLKDKWFRRVETVRWKEIEEEMRREAEEFIKRIVPELKEHTKQKAIEELAMMLKEEWTRSMEVEMKTGEEAIIQRIKRLTKNKRRIDRAVEKALRNKEKEWEKEEGMITWKNQINVPKDQTLRGEPTMMKGPLDTLDDTKPRS